MRFMRKRKICYISYCVNLKYLIYENVLTFLIGLFSPLRNRQRWKLRTIFELIFVGKT